MKSYSVLSFFLLAQICLANNHPQDIFILAGQSNMAGRGGVSRGRWDDRVPHECHPSSSVLRLDAHYGWELAKDPLHSDIDYNRTCGVGPGMSFANAILAKDPRIGVIGLVPCAVGGTRISRWSKGSSLYDQLVKRACSSTMDGGRVRAILWYHGESDTNVWSDAKNYKANMRKLIRDLRTDLSDPSLLIIQVALASGEGKYVETVRRAQLELGAELPDVKCVDAKGLRLKEDRLHLTTTSQVHLGLMLADAFITASNVIMNLKEWKERRNIDDPLEFLLGPLVTGPTGVGFTRIMNLSSYFLLGQ